MVEGQKGQIKDTLIEGARPGLNRDFFLEKLDTCYKRVYIHK